MRVEKVDSPQAFAPYKLILHVNCAADHGALRCIGRADVRIPEMMEPGELRADGTSQAAVRSVLTALFWAVRLP